MQPESGSPEQRETGRASTHRIKCQAANEKKKKNISG